MDAVRCIYVCVYVCACVHTCIYINTSIWIYTHFLCSTIIFLIIKKNAFLFNSFITFPILEVKPTLKHNSQLTTWTLLRKAALPRLVQRCRDVLRDLVFRDGLYHCPHPICYSLPHQSCHAHSFKCFPFSFLSLLFIKLETEAWKERASAGERDRFTGSRLQTDLLYELCQGPRGCV